MSKQAVSETQEAVIYVRYSSHSQRDVSIDQQIRACRAFAERQGIRVVDVYEDRALTGTSDKRPGFQRMIQDAERCGWSYVIVYTLDRFARDRYASAIYKRRLKDHGIKVLSAMENISDDPTGVLMESLLEGLAEYYSKELSQKVRRGHEDNARKCMVNGMLPLGYVRGEDGRYAICEPEAEIVLEIFTRVNQKENLADIVRDMNERGIRTKKGKKWNRSSFNQLLSNERYTGVYIYHDIRIPGGIPQIIPQTLFDSVQCIIQTKSNARKDPTGNRPQRRRHEKGTYLLTGKIFCGHCKQPMTGVSGTSKSGDLHFYYACKGRRADRASCRKQNIRREHIETFVTTALRDAMFTDHAMCALADAAVAFQYQNSTCQELVGLKEQLAEVNRSLANLMRAIEAGIFSATTQARLQELEDQKRDLTRLISVAESDAEELLTREDFLAILEMYRYGDVNDKRYQEALIDTFLVAAYVYDDKVKFVFNLGKDKVHTEIPFDIDSIGAGSVRASSPSGDQIPTTIIVVVGFPFFTKSFRNYRGIAMLKHIKHFIAKETVLCIAAVCAIATMFIIPPDQEYLHYIDFRVLCLLLCLMAVVAGLKAIGVFHWLTYQLLHRLNSGHTLSVTLILLPFFSSMFVTNDVALIIFIPFTLMLLDQLGCSRSIIPVTVFQTVAANLGSMATPVGNPQNLYLYAFYNMSICDFFSVTLPLTAVSLIALSVAAIPLLPKHLPKRTIESAGIQNGNQLLIYLTLFVLCLLTVFRIIPYLITTVITLAVLFVLDRKLLKEIDYLLLLTFVCFFTVSENLGRVDGIRTFLQQLLQKNTLLSAVTTSQVISNVPAAILLSGFTDQWQQMLAGVNIGGLGTPIASLASLITIKFYMRWPGAKMIRFLGYFTLVNVIALAILLLFAQII